MLKMRWRSVYIGLVVAEIFGEIFRFLPSHPKRCRCSPYNLWGYWADLDQIYIQCSCNIAIKYFWIKTAIFLSVSERQSAEWRLFCKFRPKLVDMATSFEKSEKELQVEHLRTNINYFLKNRKNRSSDSWDRPNWGPKNRKKRKKRH